MSGVNSQDEPRRPARSSLHSPDSGTIPELHLSKREEHRCRGGCGSGLKTQGGQLPTSGGHMGMYEGQAAHLAEGYVSITRDLVGWDTSE